LPQRRRTVRTLLVAGHCLRADRTPPAKEAMLPFGPQRLRRMQLREKHGSDTNGRHKKKTAHGNTCLIREITRILMRYTDCSTPGSTAGSHAINQLMELSTQDVPTKLPFMLWNPAVSRRAMGRFSARRATTCPWSKMWHHHLYRCSLLAFFNGNGKKERREEIGWTCQDRRPIHVRFPV